MLAEEFGGATALWGGFWLLVSVVILVATLKVSLKFSPVIEEKR